MRSAKGELMRRKLRKVSNDFTDKIPEAFHRHLKSSFGCQTALLREERRSLRSLERVTARSTLKGMIQCFWELIMVKDSATVALGLEANLKRAGKVDARVMLLIQISNQNFVLDPSQHSWTLPHRKEADVFQTPFQNGEALRERQGEKSHNLRLEKQRKLILSIQGGFDLLGRTVDQIRTTEQVNATRAACLALRLDGLVIIGGVTSNTDAAQLAETFAETKCPTKVVGVPVTLYGDLKNQFVEMNVGFDTICRVNSQLISNICSDALSAEKYYYFVRVMSRKASHVALECALQSHPNMVILGEEVAMSKLTILDITKQICDAVQARAEQEKYHGVVLIPEGLVESIPELYALLQEIHGLHRQGVSAENIPSRLSLWASALFEFLPPFIRKELLLHPESDESAQLSQIEMEKLLAHFVEREMKRRTEEGTYKGKKFNAICHFFGYQTRGALPSKFDCDYAYVLGYICYHILATGLNGYMATVTNLKHPVNKWRCGATPITAMMTVKRYSRGPGATPIGKPALHPAMIDLKGRAYELLRQNASSFLMDDMYRNPGPIQFEGPGVDFKPFTLCVEDQDYMGRMKKIQDYLDKVKSIVKPGCSQDVLKAALSCLASVTNVLTVMSAPSLDGQLSL